MFEKRLEILNTVEPEKDWDTILNDNFKKYERYKDLLGDDDYDKAQTQLHNLLPAYFKIFNLVNQENISNNRLNLSTTSYDTGIYLVGYSIMPVILSILQIQPSSIVFVATDDTQDFIDEIKNGIKSVADKYYQTIEKAMELTTIKDLSDPAEVFQIIDRIIYKYEGKKLAIDITGGKKTMVAGAFMASAHSRTCDIFYIDFEQYNSRNSEPVYGTEFLANLPNPSEIFSLTDWDRLISLKENYQFKEALIEVEKIKNNIKKYGKYFSDKFTDELTRLKTEITGFAFWDDYRYKQALTYLPDSPALKVLQKISQMSVTNIQNAKKKIYEKSDLLAYYLLDRLENSCRRKKQGQHQNAFLGFASLIEFIMMMWSDIKLSNSERSYLKKSRYFTYNDLLFYLKRKGDCRINSSVYHGDLKKLQKIRNNHTLIHSITAIGSQETDMAEKNAERVIQNLLGIKTISKSTITKYWQNVKF